MTGRERVIVTAVFVVAVIGGAFLAFNVLGGGSSEPTSVASASATPKSPTAPPTATVTPGAPTATPSQAPSPLPTPEPTPSAALSATPRPTTAPGPAASITLAQLTLDAADDPDGKDRLVSFTTGGAGTITVALTSITSQGTTRMCLSADGKALGCKTAAEGKLTARTTKKAASFELTLRGKGLETPVVDVAITFPATKPSVTIANARFDGTSFPGTNGIQAIVQPRSDGDVHMAADWGGHPFLYEVDLIEQGGNGSQTLANQGPATRMDERLPVTASNPWKVVLQNIETGMGTTPMTATIGWP